MSSSEIRTLALLGLSTSDFYGFDEIQIYCYPSHSMIIVRHRDEGIDKYKEGRPDDSPVQHWYRGRKVTYYTIPVDKVSELKEINSDSGYTIML
jgi:hypothetical protein